MFRRLDRARVLCSVAGVVLLFSGAVFWDARADTDDTLQAQESPLLDPAKKAYQASSAAYQVGTVGFEDIYVWSRLWMEAELKGTVTPKEAQAGKQAHLKRMQNLHLSIKALYDEGVRGGEAEKYHATRYYVAEAKLLVSE